MKLYVAACSEPEIVLSISKGYVHLLYSWLNDMTYIKKCRNVVKKTMIIDSGAHSWNKFVMTRIGSYALMSEHRKLPDPKLFLDKYVNYIINDHSDAVFVEFDVYGVLTMKEIDEAYGRVVEAKGKKKIMRVYHPLVDGGSLKVLKKWIREGQDYVGVGGDSKPLFSQIFALTRDEVKVHGFALKGFKYLTMYPFYSVDSSTLVMVEKYGKVFKPTFKNCLRTLTSAGMKRHKNIEIFHEKRRRWEEGTLAWLRAEEWLTRLWEKKGVHWDD